MRIEPEKIDLLSLLLKQLDSHFTADETDRQVLADLLPKAIERTEYCFSQSQSKYYRKDGDVRFNLFHSAQYCTFLYFLSNTIFLERREHRSLADRVYYLNKCMNGLDLFYEVMMPRVFLLEHPVGSVLGRANYGDFFSCYQNCTVGSTTLESHEGAYPTFGENVKLMSGAKVLGNCKVGDNVVISANTYIKDLDVPSCSLVFGQSPDNVIKQREEAYFLSIKYIS